MIAVLKRWLFPHLGETDALVGQRNEIVVEARAASAKATTQALDLIEETQAEWRAINDLLAQMDKRRHARTPPR